MAGIMVEIGLLLAGWYGRTGRNWGGIEVLALEGAGLGAPPLALEVIRSAGSGGCHQFHRCFRERVVFVSVQQNNYSILHTNLN